MANDLNNNLRVQLAKHLDEKYGGDSGIYTNEAEALAAIPSYERLEGLTVLIREGASDKKEFWFDENGDLQVKTITNNNQLINGSNYITAASLPTDFVSASAGGTFTGSVLFNSEITANTGLKIPNNSFISLQRNTAGIYIPVLGIPSGTDEVRLRSSGGFNFVNNSISTVLAITGGGALSWSGVATGNGSGITNVNAASLNGVGAAIADLGGGASLADVITKVNVILATMRTRNLIAT